MDIKPQTKDIIEVRNLNFSYSKNNSKDFFLKNINLTIKKNEISVFLGANGSGKSTLLKLMARLIKLKNGNIFLKIKIFLQYLQKILLKK